MIQISSRSIMSQPAPAPSTQPPLAHQLLIAHRFETVERGWQVDLDLHLSELFERVQGSGNVAVARIEIALQPILSGAHIGAKRGLVASKQGDSCREQSHAQILAQKELLAGREQGHLRHIDLLYPYQALNLAPRLARDTHKCALFSRRRRSLILAWTLLHREWDLIDPTRDLIQAHAHDHDVDEGCTLQSLDVARDGAAQGGELQTVSALQPIVRALECNQRSLQVARQLKLLGTKQQDLLDLGQYTLVAIARQLEVERLEREALILGLRHSAFEPPNLELEVAQRLARIDGHLAALLPQCTCIGELLGELLLQRPHAAASIQPNGAEQHDDDGNRDGGEGRQRLQVAYPQRPLGLRRRCLLRLRCRLRPLRIGIHHINGKAKNTKRSRRL